MNSQRFVMVSEWMENGNINEFVKTHRNVDRIKLVRLRFRRYAHPSLMILSHSSERSLAGLYICTIRE